MNSSTSLFNGTFKFRIRCIFFSMAGMASDVMGFRSIGRTEWNWNVITKTSRLQKVSIRNYHHRQSAGRRILSANRPSELHVYG